MSRCLLLNFEDFGLNEGITQTVKPSVPFCICCLDREGPMIDLENCGHSDYLNVFDTIELKLFNQLVCTQCHHILKKIKCFQKQILESYDILLSQTFTDHTVNSKKVQLTIQKVGCEPFLSSNLHHDDEMIESEDLPTICIEDNFTDVIQNSSLEENFNNEISTMLIEDENLIREQNLILQQNFNHEQDLIQEHLIQGGNLIQEQNLIQEENLIQDKNLLQEENLMQEQNLIQKQNLIQQQSLLHEQNLLQEENLIQEQNLMQGNLIQEQNLLQEENLIQEQNLMQGNLIQEQNLLQEENLIQEQNLLQEENLIQPQNLLHHNILNLEQNKMNKNIKTALEILERNNQNFINLSGQLQILDNEDLISLLGPSLLSKEFLTDIPLAPTDNISTDLENGLLNNAKSLEMEIGPDKILYDNLSFSPDLDKITDTSEGFALADVLNKDEPKVKVKKKCVKSGKLKKNVLPVQLKIRRVKLTHEELDRERVMQAQSCDYLKFKFRCETCIIGFNFKLNLEDHIKRKHTLLNSEKTDSNSIVCDICSQIIPNKGSITEHNYRHYTRYECMRCEKRFHSHDEALRHYARNKCSKSFTAK